MVYSRAHYDWGVADATVWAYKKILGIIEEMPNADTSQEILAVKGKIYPEYVDAMRHEHDAYNTMLREENAARDNAKNNAE